MARKRDFPYLIVLPEDYKENPYFSDQSSPLPKWLIKYKSDCYLIPRIFIKRIVDVLENFNKQLNDHFRIDKCPDKTFTDKKMLSYMRAQLGKYLIPVIRADLELFPGNFLYHLNRFEKEFEILFSLIVHSEQIDDTKILSYKPNIFRTSKDFNVFCRFVKCHYAVFNPGNAEIIYGLINKGGKPPEIDKNEVRQYYKKQIMFYNRVVKTNKSHGTIEASKRLRMNTAVIENLISIKPSTWALNQTRKQYPKSGKEYLKKICHSN